MRYENGMARQPRASSRRSGVGLRTATAICCLFGLSWPTTAWAQDTAAPELPAELRPLDIIRPTLPEDAAAEVAELEKRVADLQERGLTAETPEAQDAALDEAIGLAEQMLAIRAEHQTRWTDARGDAAEWYEVADARRAIADLRRLRNLDDQARAELASLTGTDDEVQGSYEEGKYADARAVTEHQLDVRRRVLGDEHPHTLTSVAWLGFLLLSQGKLAEAVPYHREALEGNRRVLGAEHPQTLISIGNMGSLLQSNGRLAEAEPYYREALSGNRRVLGEEHPNALTLMTNLGSLLLTQGKLAEAEPYYRQALEGRRKLADESLNTLATIDSMGFLLQEQGKLTEAERYYREALKKKRRVLGDGHPLTLGSMNNLGGLLLSQGKLAEAEPYLREVLDQNRRELGDEHPRTLTSINNMGHVLFLQGRLVEAEPYFRESLETKRRVLGDDHPSTLTSIGNMGSLLLSQGRVAEAEPYAREAMDGNRRVLGDEHPGTLISIGNMGSLLQSNGRLAEAEPYHREALAGHRRVLGEEHLNTLTSIEYMGILLRAQGRLAEAEPYYSKAMATAERLRTDVIGGAQERASFAGKLNLVGIAFGYAELLIETDRAGEALNVLERGRGRAALDLMTAGAGEVEALLRATGDAQRINRYDTAVATEQAALVALRDAESQLPALNKEREAVERAAALPDDDKATRVSELDAQMTAGRERVFTLRRELAEHTAAVFAELRGLIPAGDPLSTRELLAALSPDEAMVSYSWNRDGVLALVAHAGRVEGVTLAKGRDDVEALGESVAVLRSAIARRPASGAAVDAAVLAAAREALLPEAVRSAIASASSVTMIPDGPLHGLPIELLIEGTPIAYAPSATIAIDRRRAAEGRKSRATGAVVLADPDFGGLETQEPPYPDSGVLVTMVASGSNADIAGLRRGDVLLTYGEHALTTAADLGPAIQATAEALATRGTDDADDAGDRPVTAEVWRDGEIVQLTLATGRMGVAPSRRAPADGLRSMAFAARSADQQSTHATVLEQIRLYGGGLAPLPGTRREAEAIAAMLGADATLLLGADANAVQLREAVASGTPRILHLATHGLTGNAARPLEASLALTVPDEPTPDDIGFLTLQEIISTWAGKLDGTELVVLSACDTALGVAKGDSVMALPLGFFVCGAETVVASLWKVDDTATALLMSRFYANYLGRSESVREVDGDTYSAGEPLPKLAALREARLWLRSLTTDERGRLTGASPHQIAEAATRDPAPPRGRIAPADARRDAKPYDHPYYWSAFVLYGSAR